MFFNVSLTWVRARFMFIYVFFVYLCFSCFLCFLWFSWFWDGQGLQIYVFLCLFMFFYVSLTWARARFMFIHVLCLFMFFYVFDGVSWFCVAKASKFICFYVFFCFFMFFFGQGPDLGQGRTLTQPMKPQGINQKFVLKLVFKIIASNIDKPCHWPGPAHLAWPGLQASRPPGLQGSRPPGLQASRPPGLQLKIC